MAAAAVLLGALLALRVASGGGPSAAVVAGDAFVGAGRPADLAVVHEHSTGYDGQFVYRLALDPFTRAATADGIRLDNPPYRQQRLGLPLVAHAVTRAGVPLSVTLLLVNAAALLAAAWAGAVLARRAGRHALWGVLVGLSPGLVVSVTRDLTEPLQTALLLLGLVAWTGRRTAVTTVAATLAFTAAVLTRETALAVLVALGGWELWRASRRDATAARLGRALALCVPAAAALAWQLHLRAVWGVLPVSANEGDVGLPFLNTAATFLAGGGAWADWTSRDALLAHAWVAERVLLLAVLLYAAATLPRGRSDPATRAGWVGAALLAFSAAWGRDVAFLRATNEAIVLGVVVLLGVRTRGATAALAGAAGLSCYLAVVYGLLV